MLHQKIDLIYDFYRAVELQKLNVVIPKIDRYARAIVRRFDPVELRTELRAELRAEPKQANRPFGGAFCLTSRVDIFIDYRAGSADQFNGISKIIAVVGV